MALKESRLWNAIKYPIGFLVILLFLRIITSIEYFGPIPTLFWIISIFIFSMVAIYMFWSKWQVLKRVPKSEPHFNIIRDIYLAGRQGNIDIPDLIITDDGRILSEPSWDVISPVGRSHYYFRILTTTGTRHFWYDRANRIIDSEIRGGTRLNSDPKEAIKIANEIAILIETGQVSAKTLTPALIEHVIEKQVAEEQPKETVAKE